MHRIRYSVNGIIGVINTSYSTIQPLEIYIPRYTISYTHRNKHKNKQASTLYTMVQHPYVRTYPCRRAPV